MKTVRVGVMEKVLRKPREEVFLAARRLGFDGLELEPRTSPEAIRELSAVAGLPVCSVLCDGEGLGSEVTEERLIARQRLVDAIRTARQLGAEGVLLPHFEFTDLNNGAAARSFMEDVASCLPEAEALAVTVAWENALDAAATRAVLEGMGSEWFRCYYDFANGAKRGADPAAELRELGDWVYQVHAKNLHRQPLDAPGVDLAACLRALWERDYSGWVVLETAPGEDADASAGHNLRVVRDTWASLA